MPSTHMCTRKKLFSLLLLTSLSLAGCGGGDRFSNETSAGDSETEGGDTETSTETTLDLGSGSGGSFSDGAVSTDIPAGTSLSFGGDSVVTVNVVDDTTKALYTDAPVTVSFSSNCSESGDATITSPIITSNGTAETTYSASTCEGPDTITASLEDGTSALVNITVAEQAIGTLEFVSATPTTIALSGGGSSSNPEFSELSFIVRDGIGQPMSGETVSFTLSTTIGGISLSADSALTDGDGLVNVTLNSGSVNSSVTVTASVDDGSGGEITSASNPIAIVGGLPDQDSFDISATVLNPGGWDFNGITSTITVRAGDRFNNSAPDGTQIAFVSDGGSITGTCALSDGACSVTWTSQSPRPGDSDGDGACDVGSAVECGWVHILARTVGEESFTDTNGNGQYDIGEPILRELDEAFNDLNDNGSYDSGEFFSDFNENGSFDSKPDSLFQGSNCSEAAEAAGHCSRLVEVRDSITLCMSTDTIDTRTFDDTGTEVSPLSLSVTAGTEESTSFSVSFQDLFGNIPADGTTVSISSDNGEFIGSTSIAIPNSCRKVGDAEYTLRIKGDGTTSSGNIFIDVTQRDGLTRQTVIGFDD